MILVFLPVHWDDAESMQISHVQKPSGYDLLARCATASLQLQPSPCFGGWGIAEISLLHLQWL